MAQAKPQQQNQQPAERPGINQEIARLRDQLMVHESDIKAMIQGMTVDQFFGLIKRACIANPDLLRADRLSLIQAALDCANDGLKPDGREGAFVCFNTRVMENGKWIDGVVKAQWMPMIRGIIKKILNVETVKSVKAEPIFKNDHFERWSDDDGEHMRFRPERGDRGPLESYFAAIWMKDSVVFVEEMTPTDIEKVRSVSKSKDNAKGPWMEWPEEMAKKTIIKRLSKRVPLSPEVERLMARDDEMMLAQMRDITPKEERPKGIENRLNALADNRGMSNVDMGNTVHEREREPARQQDQERKPAQNQQTQKQADPVPMDVDGAYDRGIADKAAGKGSVAMPKEYRQNEDLAKAWQRGYRGEDNGAADNSNNGDEANE